MSKSIEETQWYSYTSSTQTMRTWARHIEAFEDVPESFQDIFPQQQEPFPYTVYLPEDKSSKFFKRDEKIISVFENHFVLLESINDEIIIRSSEFSDVVIFERGKILLNSWVKIKTSSDTFDLRFNTTNDHLLQPVEDIVRQKMAEIALAGEMPRNEIEAPDLSKFNFLDKINFKFLNYGRASIRSNDRVLDVIYQPELTLQNIRFFNKTVFKRYKTDHLFILTDKELIFIQEDKQIRNNFDPAHGGVFIFIPRYQIQDVAFTPHPESSSTMMEITLPNNTQFSTEFSSTNENLPRLQGLLG